MGEENVDFERINMAKTIDARKMECPAPVMLTAQAIKDNAEVTTIVDNKTAEDNVAEFAKSQGFTVAIAQKNDGTYLTLTKIVEKPKEATKPEPGPVTTAGIVVFIGSDIIGRGENTALGSLLMQSFLHTVGGLNVKPETIIFMNNGVKLVTVDSPVLADLKELNNQGIEIIACGTCLSRLELSEKVAVGKVSNMYTITETMFRASKVIAL
jgi:selenium metabolism protein YedF